MKKIWKVKEAVSQDYLDKFPEINPVVLQLLKNRGIDSQQKIDEFMNPDYSQDVHDPFLFQDMKKAVTRIVRAVAKKEKVVVHGDYDADGVCSSVVLVETLRQLGIKQANLYIYIPHRNTEGYGLNEDTVKNLIKAKVNLIITTDCGISNWQEVDQANQAGIDVIITDHHHVPAKLPDAYAIINPKVKTDKYPFADLAGVGVAFKLAQAVRRQQKLEGSFEKWLLDVVAIGTVADSVPLVGENRTLVRYGLIVLNKTRRLGLHKLIEKARIQIGSIDAKAISFQIAPRLNAAGRIEHANTAYQLLITNNEKASQELADQLEATNQQRQKITEKLTTIAQAQIGELADRLVLFVSEQGEDWQAGIIGLIAGKISASHFRPTFVICKRENEFIGSGRSIEYLDIMEVLENSNKYLHKFGGHPQACGFTIDSQANLDNFQITATKFISNQLKDKDLRPQMDIEAEVMLDQVDWDLLEMMNCFSPFGEGNRRPIFVVKNVELTNFELVGLEKQHLRIFVKDKKGTVKKTIAFGFGQIAEKLEVGKNIDLVFSMGVNEWNGNRELQLKVIDLNLHD